MREYSIERMLRDAKTIQNLGETNLIQKALIGEQSFYKTASQSCTLFTIERGEELKVIP